MFKGSLVALVTPMTAGTGPLTPIDFFALERLVEFHIEQGTDGLVAVGTTGESATLSDDEHCEVVRRVVAYARGRVPVVAGTGANSTWEAIHYTQSAREAGADACLLVTPYYNKPTQEGLVQHLTAVANAVPIPQILYNVPGRTACDLLPDTVARLAEVDNIIGIKEATGDLDRVARLRAGCGKDFLLLSGDDATAREFIARGGDGVISVTANVAPKLMHEMCAAMLAGNETAARALDDRLQPLHRDLFRESNPIPVKWAVTELGLAAPGIRLPLTWLSAPWQPVVRQALAHAGVL